MTDGTSSDREKSLERKMRAVLKRVSPMGRVLRELANGDLNGEGPVEVMTRYQDFNIVTVQGPNGQPVNAPANSLISFTAQRFRELTDEGGRTDTWEFRVDVPTGAGAPPTSARMYLAGRDLLLVRALSAVV